MSEEEEEWEEDTSGEEEDTMEEEETSGEEEIEAKGEETSGEEEESKGGESSEEEAPKGEETSGEEEESKGGESSGEEEESKGGESSEEEEEANTEGSSSEKEDDESGESEVGVEKEEWVLAAQKRTFTNWMNHKLEGTGHQVTTLETDLADGVILTKLLEILSHKEIQWVSSLLLAVLWQPHIKMQLENVYYYPTYY